MDVKKFIKDKKVSAFLQGKKVLIVDPSGTVRSLARKITTALELKSGDVKTADSFPESQDLIQKFAPHFLFTDQNYPQGSGFELSDLHKKVVTDSTSRFLIMSSDKASPASAAMAAEEEVDLYLMKPLTYVTLEQEFFKVLEPKITKQDYLMKISNIQSLMGMQKFDEALGEAKAAQKLDTSSCMAFFYEGSIHRAKKDQANAKDAFQAGLKIKADHYKCLVGLYELLMEAQEFGEAYETLKTLTKFHPINPKRIPEIIRLFIITKNFTDLEQSAAFLNTLDKQDEIITTYIGAGLTICGKYFLRQNDKSKAAGILLKAASLVPNKPKIIQEIMRTLFESKLTEEANTLMKKLPDELRDSPDFQLLWLEEVHQTGNAQETLKVCADLLQKKIENPRLHEIMILRSKEMGRSKTVVKELVWKASQAFPEDSAKFEKLGEDDPSH